MFEKHDLHLKMWNAKLCKIFCFKILYVCVREREKEKWTRKPEEEILKSLCHTSSWKKLSKHPYNFLKVHIIIYGYDKSTRKLIKSAPISQFTTINQKADLVKIELEQNKIKLEWM